MMNKRLPLDDFERNIQKLADGFEIKPRNIVFDNIRYELSGEGSAPAAKGRIIKSVFSKGLTFIGYAAAAAVLTVSTVFIPQPKNNDEEANLRNYQKNAGAYSKELLIDTTREELNTHSEQVVLTEKDRAKLSTIATETENSTTTDFDKNSITRPGSGFKETKAGVVISSGKAMDVTTGDRPKSGYIGKHRNLDGQAGNQIQRKNEKQEVKEIIPEQITSTPRPVSDSQNNLFTQNKNEQSDSIHNRPQQEEQLLSFTFPDSLNIKGKDSSALTNSAYTSVLKRGVWSLAAFYSYDQITNTYRVKQNSFLPFDDYQSLRDKTSQTAYGYRTGVKVEYSLLNHISVSSGLSYSFTTDRIGTISGIQSVFDSVKQVEVDKYVTYPGYEVILTNAYHYLEVPLAVSYSNTLYNRFACRVTAGLSYGYLFGSHAYYLTKATDDPFFIPDYQKGHAYGSNPFSHSMLNLNLGAYVSYLASPRIEVFAGPNMRKTLSSLYKGNYLATQKFTTFGSEVGVRFFF